MPSLRSSLVYCTVSEFSADLDGVYAADAGSVAKGPSGSLAMVSDPAPLLTLTMRGAGDGGVVDQHVEVAEALLDLLRCRPRGGRVGDVQGDRVRVAACDAQRRGGLLAASRVPGADQDRHAQGGQLLGSRAADPLVRP